jgi:hypothetical protein
MRVGLSPVPVRAVCVVVDPDARALELLAATPLWRVFEFGAVDVPPPGFDQSLRR